MIQAMNSSVGSPPGTTCSGACACATACEQRRQAYLGRRVTSTRNCAGITSSRSDTSSPIFAISPQPQGQSVLAGSITRSIPGQMRRQMTTVALRLAGLFPARPLQRGLGLLLCGLEHALGQFGIFQRQVELIGRQLLGALAELLALRRAQDVFQPTIGFLQLGQRRLDLAPGGLSEGHFPGREQRHP